MRCLLICVFAGIVACAAEDIHCEAVELVQTKLLVSKTSDVATTVESTRSFKLIGGGIVLGIFILLCVVGSPTVIISTAIFLDLFLTTVNTPLAPTLTSSYGWIALLTASKNVVTCMIAPLAGGLIDSNESVAMQVGMFLEMLCTFCLAAVKNYWFWLAVRCISGVSTAGIVWGGFALCNQIHAKEADARRKAMAMASGGVYAGVILGPQVGGLFVEEEDTRTLFLLLLCIQLCAFLAIRFRLRLSISQPAEMQTESKVNMMALLLDPGIRNPILALMMALGFIASLGSTAFEYMVRLGYSQMLQNFTWLMVSVPAIIFVYLVPYLRHFMAGETLQTLAMCLAGSTALLCFTGNYFLLSMMFLGASVAAGVVDANTPALLADQSHAKYGGTGLVFVLSNVADQAAFVWGPAVGSFVCELASFPLMSQTFGLCMLFSAWLLYTSTNAGKEVIVENVESSTHSPTLKHLKPATRCLQNRGDAEDGVGSFGAPIYMSQAFLYQGPGQPYPKGSIYGRFGHPTRTKLEEGLAALHLVKHALTFSSYEAWVLDELV